MTSKARKREKQFPYPGEYEEVASIPGNGTTFHCGRKGLPAKIITRLIIWPNGSKAAESKALINRLAKFPARGQTGNPGMIFKLGKKRGWLLPHKVRIIGIYQVVKC
jgi:hypothetical protein